MADLAHPGFDFGARLWRAATLFLDSYGTEISPSSQPFLSLLLRNAKVEQKNSETWQLPVTYGRNSLQYIADKSEMTSPTDYRTALFGQLCRAGIPVDLDTNEIPADGGGSVVAERVAQGVSDVLAGLESALFSNGTGASNTIAGLRTALPLADTGAYFNIPATRSNWTTNVYHYWATNSSRGGRVSNLLGATFTVTDMLDPDYGLFATLDKLKTHASTRKFSQFVCFVNFTVHSYLKRYLFDMGMLEASTGPDSWLPDDYKGNGFTVLKAGGTHIVWNDIKFVPTEDLHSNYDAIMIPFRCKGKPTIYMPWHKPNLEGVGEGAKQKKNIITLFPFQRPTKGMYYEAPMAFTTQMVISGLSGCVALKSDGSYDSTIF